MRRENKLYSYIMTSDSGFAPNPFHDICTLATCKPETRRLAKKGDWILGFSGKSLKVYNGRNSSRNKFLGRRVYADGRRNSSIWITEEEDWWMGFTVFEQFSIFIVCFINFTNPSSIVN